MFSSQQANYLLGEEMFNEQKDDDKSEDSIDFSKGIPNFILKTAIVTIAITLSISYLLPEMPKMPKIPETQRNKLILLSFVQNPYVLWKLSIMEEEKGNYKKAVTYIEAAIGLMEMNGASDQSLRKYQERLEKINSK